MNFAVKLSQIQNISDKNSTNNYNPTVSQTLPAKNESQALTINNS